MSPIKPENRARYGPDWPEFSRSIRFDRAAGRCECEGECGRGTHDGRCPNEHHGAAYGTGSRVVLTTAHLCHTPECREHVRAMCQGCHLHYDRDHHAVTRRVTLAANRADMDERNHARTADLLATPDDLTDAECMTLFGIDRGSN